MFYFCSLDLVNIVTECKWLFWLVCVENWKEEVPFVPAYCHILFLFA
jgi:hypothetical protein